MRAPMTLKGSLRLRAELEELKSVKRPAVIQAIAEARAHGDLKENAEYHAAREQQGFIEGRIKQLESELSHAQVIDITPLPRRICAVHSPMGRTLWCIPPPSLLAGMAPPSRACWWSRGSSLGITASFRISLTPRRGITACAFTRRLVISPL